MAHKYEVVTTGNGYWVDNDGTRTQVITQDGQIIMGSTSAPQVLNTNPGANVIGQTINLLHSAGAGDCTDLYGSYTKVAMTGDGDSGTTLVGSAPRAYVGTSAGTTVADEVYGTQPWAKHSGTGTIEAMSAVSAALILNDADAFTSTNSINAGHFHIKTYAGQANGTVTSSNFDGVMIEVYENVTGMDSMLHLSTAATVTSAIQIDGGSSLTNVLDIDDTTGCVNVASTGNDAWVPNNKGTFTQQGQLKISIGGNTFYIPYGTVA